MLDSAGAGPGDRLPARDEAPMTFDYARYLAAKTTVDDRALNRHVLAGLCRLMPAGAPQVLEVGAGLGQPRADPPVIDVAAARPAGVIEPLGDYYVDPHDVPALQSACRTKPASTLPPS